MAATIILCSNSIVFTFDIEFVFAFVFMCAFMCAFMFVCIGVCVTIVKCGRTHGKERLLLGETNSTVQVSNAPEYVNSPDTMKSTQ